MCLLDAGSVRTNGIDGRSRDGEMLVSASLRDNGGATVSITDPPAIFSVTQKSSSAVGTADACHHCSLLSRAVTSLVGPFAAVVHRHVLFCSLLSEVLAAGTASVGVSFALA